MCRKAKRQNVAKRDGFVLVTQEATVDQYHCSTMALQ
jgi:hypothetical protein